MDNGIWTILIGSLSVLLGWLLNEISQLFVSKRENRKVRKKVLFELLEVHFILKKLDLWDLSEYLVCKLEEKFGEKVPEDEKQGVLIMIQKGLLEKIEQTAWEELEEIDKTYNDAVQELSAVDPIRAYCLRNKTRLINQTDLFREYVQDIENQIKDEEDINDFKQVADPLILKKFKNEVEDLRDEISSLAGTIGRRTRKEIDNILIPDKLDDNEDVNQFIDVTIEKMIKYNR